MPKVYFICDESGAKGYADKKEKYIGETGVMAGYIIHSDEIDEFRSELDTIIQRYITEGKLHITDLVPENQESLRNDIFTYLIKKQVPCLYEAIHSEGFHQYDERVKELMEKVEFEKKSNIKIPSSHNKDLLHKNLFQSSFGKAIAFCIDNIDEKIDLTVLHSYNKCIAPHLAMA
ncbi:MAG: hypothetical protein PF484_14240 [Bacteroidales bacterium]|jgi:hypothetical protein|nr:hypothetical protein [Bacteroidales bacterium]